ncbi:MAG: flavin reductase family protein [Oscillospiraceae bacterium]
MSKITWKASTLLAPVPPAMVSCGDMEISNIITIAWTGIVNTIPPMTYISIRPERYSYEMIKTSGEFVINLTDKNLIRAADWCGARTGTKHDKFKEMNLTKETVSKLSCPAIAQSPLNLECKVKDIIHLGSHDMFLSEIIAINVEEKLIDETGRLRLDKACLAAFAHGEYFELGKKIGSFGFAVKKKKTSNNKNYKKQ